MCGIVGFINVSGGLAFKLENAFKQMLFVDQLRGADATGVAYMPPDGDFNWIKQGVPPEEFFADKNVRSFFSKFKTTGFAIGHNRAKTIGHNTADNAHPFETGDDDKSKALGHNHIIGVHNGTITNKYDLCTDGYKYAVDSHAFMAGVSERGIRETVKNSDGAFSVVYFDVNEKTINFVRNKERPMYFLEVSEPDSSANMPDREYILFGSELLMLMWVASRNGLKPGQHFETKPLEHYSFKPGSAKPTIFTCEEYKDDKAWKYPSYSRSWSRKNAEPKMVEIGTPPKKDLMLPHNVRAFPKAVSAPTEVPFDLKNSIIFLGKTYSDITKAAVARIWNTSAKESLINFQVTDAVDLTSSMQITGILAGKKKVGLPIIVSSIVDKAFFDRIKPDTILCGKLMHKQETVDKKHLEFIVKDPMILAFGNTDDLTVTIPGDDSVMDQQLDEVMNAQC
jgi:predicted glutamine amidotransferase